MGALDSKKKDKLHTRKINLTAYDADDDCVIIEGELIDNNLIEIMRMSGDIGKPGIIHHMIIRLLVGPPGLTIKAAKAEMPHCPHEECIETRKSLEKMIGISIESGFSENVITLLGGSNGCTHLTALLISMGPEAVHGYYHPQDGIGFSRRRIGWRDTGSSNSATFRLRPGADCRNVCSGRIQRSCERGQSTICCVGFHQK